MIEFVSTVTDLARHQQIFRSGFGQKDQTPAFTFLELNEALGKVEKFPWVDTGISRPAGNIFKLFFFYKGWAVEELLIEASADDCDIRMRETISRRIATEKAKS